MNRFVPIIPVLLILPSFVLKGQRSINAFRMQDPIVVDGIHEPENWAGADSAVEFIQMEPEPGDTSTVLTVCYIGYDDENIYLSANLYQNTEVLAKVMNRDVLTKGDDCFALVIDTYNDNRSGYGFWTNALGTQTEFRINDDGRNLDVNWDTEWRSAAYIHPDGWSVEMLIPFSSIQFKPGLTTWGINFGRVLISNFETSYWSGTLTDDFRISQGGKLTGISLPERRGKLTLFPYASVRYENNKFTGVYQNVRLDAGADMKWQITPNITADGTVNPDFATVEADEEQINLTRYELNYPEKRLFFQEGNEMYSTRIRTFYSRRIQDILYGVKMNGKAGKYHFNMLNVRTRQLGEDDEPPTFFSTARVKRDFLGSSTVGITAVDRRNDSSYVTSLSGDYVLNLGDTWQLTGQFVASIPGDLLPHSAWFVRFAKESSYYHMHLRYTEVGEHFRENVNQTGYVVDDDRREVDSDFQYRIWIRNRIFQYIEIESRNNIFWARTNGYLRSWYLTEGIEYYLQNRFSFEYSYNNEFKLFDKKYYNHAHTFELGYNKAEWSHAEIGCSFGHNFDRDFLRFSIEGSIKLTDQLAAEYSGDLIRFTPDPDSSSTIINVVSLNYNFTKDLWVKVFAQNSTSSNKVYFYGMAGWRFKPPFGALYLIYSHDQESVIMDEPACADAIFLKLTYPISLVR